MKKITLLVALLVASLTTNAQLLIDEDWDDLNTLVDYFAFNVSDDSVGSWFQGNPEVFTAYDGERNSYIGANFALTSAPGRIIDLWGVTPLLDYKNGDIFSFYTRTIEESTFPDRLEIRLDPDGSGIFPTSGDPGSYTNLLLSINPDLELGGYPEEWTLQTVTISGLPAGTTSTRVAFRYWVTDAGLGATNSNYIGIDRLVVESVVLSVEEQSFEGFEHYVTNNLLHLSANTTMEKVTLYNILGQQVVSQKLTSNNETISLSELQSGIYIAKVSIDGARSSFKIVKK